MSRKRGPLTGIRHLLEYSAIRSLCSVLRPLSAKMVFRLGTALGTLSYHWAKKRRRVARINLNLAFGNEKSDAEKDRIIKGSFTQMAVSAFQCLWIWGDPRRVHQLIEGEPAGLDLLRTCLERNKGIFFLTAHYGNWEVMGIDHGFRNVCNLHSIIRRLDNPHLDRMVMKFRTVSGNGIFYRDESPLRIVRALQDNHAVAVMMDQNTARNGIFVDFFGRKAATPRSVALLSHRTGTPILPLFSHPTGKGTYRIEYGPELRLEKTDHKEEDVLQWTQACERFIENVIRRRPEPWMWAHRRLKTRPPDEPEGKIY